MTANQINYFKAQEEARANRASEAIKYESNIISAAANDIARRNADTNALNANVNLMNARTRENEHWETVRANLARENENRRANMASEQIKFASLEESRRSNMANEAITSAYNTGRLSQGEATLWDNEYQLKLDARKQDLEEAKFAEQQRHAKVEERQGAVSTLTGMLKNALPYVSGLVGILA